MYPGFFYWTGLESQFLGWCLSSLLFPLWFCFLVASGGVDGRRRARSLDEDLRVGEV